MEHKGMTGDVLQGNPALLRAEEEFDGEQLSFQPHREVNS